MSVLPRVLVVDDLIGNPVPEAIDIQNREDYCRSLGLRDEVDRSEPNYQVIARAHISSGQVLTPSGPENRLEVVQQAFQMGWPDESGGFWSAALVDIKFGDDSRFGLRIIDLLHRLAPELPIIVVSSLNQLQLRAGETLRHAAERLGAQDFLAVSGVDFDVEPAHRSTPANLSERLEALGLMPDPEQQIVGHSLAVCRMLKSVRALIPKDIVGQALLLGEAGSGKSHLLGYVHRHVARIQNLPPSRVRYQNITLAGTGEDMQSKALFGTTAATGVKESFGAFHDVKDGGVLFLDEIGELVASSQSDLLGTLQPLTDDDGTRYRDVRRMGAREGNKSRCFVLAATNRNLEAMAREGKFNDALLQRFANREVRVPSLRERKSDLPMLVRHFLQIACRQYGVGIPKVEISSAQWEDYAEDHAVRELATLIESAISRNRFKTLLTERDIFGVGAASARQSSGPAVTSGVGPVGTSFPEESAPGAGQADSVSGLVAILDSWVPDPSMDPSEFDHAFVKLDTALGRAKLRLWRDLVDKQKKLTGAINLLATARQLLGRQKIVNSKSGDLAAQTFADAGIGERPNDPILGEIWDRRRFSKRSPKDDSRDKEKLSQC